MSPTRSKKPTAPAVAEQQSRRPVVYQLFVRLFGNTVENPVPHGVRERNGCGTFADINDAVLVSLRQMGISHIWLTGVIEHASLTGYPKQGIKADHPAVVKGIAGSPYAIRDYYDVSPDLARNPAKRMAEFEDCVKRIHAAGMKVILDFVPNHVARQYVPSNQPDGIAALGADDDTTKAFDLNNNFYYLPGQGFRTPKDHDAHQYGLPVNESYREEPAKATGDNCFEARPHHSNWFETAKLNYGYLPGTKHFVGDVDNPPSTWHKMLHIIKYWAGKGVDGFRCDMVELVPGEFWQWAINNCKEEFPELLWIGEVYDPSLYGYFLDHCGFHWLYDKVGVYDMILSLAKGEARANDWDPMLEGLVQFKNRLLRFTENHDEVRLPGHGGAGHLRASAPALLLAATCGPGPLMVYNGQELGEIAAGISGYSGNDGRTTIFDYWHMPALQRWFNGGKADGGKSTVAETVMLQEMTKLVQVCSSHPIIAEGAYYGLQYANQGTSWDYDDRHILSYLRHYKGKAVLVIVNMMDRSMTPRVKIPWEAWDAIGLHPERNFILRDLLQDDYISFSGFDVLDLRNVEAGVAIPLAAWQGRMFEVVAV